MARARKKGSKKAPKTPARPDGVPDAATWDDVTEQWQHGERDDRENRQGTWQFWRADGSLRCECSFRDDRVEGTNRRFHPGGELASEGTWRDGVLYDATFYTAPGDTDEQVVPDAAPAIAQVEYLSTDGRSNEQIRYYDADGVQCDRVGVAVPDRPDTVPATARWFSDEDFSAAGGGVGGWVDGRIERGTSKKIGRWRWWTTEGSLLRTEIYDERGSSMGGFNAGEPNPIEACLNTFLTSDHEFRVTYDLRSVWSPELHATMMAQLPVHAPGRTTDYAKMLVDGCQQVYRVYSMEIPRWREVIEVVEGFEAQQRDDEVPLESWHIYALGVKACVALADRERAARWWSKLETIEVPDKKDRPTGYPYHNSIISDATTKKGELRVAARALIDGDVQARVDEVRAALKKRGGAALDDEALSVLAASETGRWGADVILRDPDSGAAWLCDGERDGFYFDGSGFDDSWVVDLRARHDAAYVVAADRCDERVLMWGGKHNWTALQRYGRAVLWHAGSYVSGRGQGEVDRIAWLVAPSVADARALIALIASQCPKSAKDTPWFRGKNVIVREYNGEGLTSVGVWKNYWLSHAERVVETFDSHEQAVAAFERLELARMQSGSVLKRFDREGPVDVG